jgi:hypothetical protein
MEGKSFFSPSKILSIDVVASSLLYLSLAALLVMPPLAPRLMALSSSSSFSPSPSSLLLSWSALFLNRQPMGRGQYFFLNNPLSLFVGQIFICGDR